MTWGKDLRNILDRLVNEAEAEIEEIVSAAMDKAEEKAADQAIRDDGGFDKGFKEGERASGEEACQAMAEALNLFDTDRAATLNLIDRVTRDYCDRQLIELAPNLYRKA